MALALYVEPDTNASRQATAWRANDPAGAALMDKIARRAQALWLGEWSGDVSAVVDKAIRVAGAKRRVFVVYAIPQRDEGAHSAGGMADATAYRAFIAAVARGLRLRRAIVILEPDATAYVDFLSPDALAARLALMAEAVVTLTASGAQVYIDAGDSNWIPASVMAARLQAAGVAKARGFALNVSHTEATADEIRYAESLRAILGTRAHYVIDTSRNGAGSCGAVWCNPQAAGLGAAPTLSTGVDGCDAYLWVKRPGESDGACEGGPAAGAWWADYARRLAMQAG
jgi:endoglucanase